MGEAKAVRSLLRADEADELDELELSRDAAEEPVMGVVVPPTARSKLRRALVVSDVLAACAAWSLAPFVPWAPMVGVPGGWWAAVPALTGITVLLLWVAGLHRARVCSVRTTEVLRIAYVCCAMGAASQAAPPSWIVADVATTMVVGASIVFLALVASRSIFRTWLLAKRATGHLLRTVAIIGADEEAGRLGAHLEEHPEVGYGVIGYFRSSVSHAAHLARPVLGQALDAPAVLREMGITGAIVVPGALLPSERQEVLAGLAAAQVHVHLATGLQGVDSRRLRSLPMGHEPLLYLEPPGRNAPWYPYLKRVIDIVGASAVLLLTAPLFALAAIAIKVTDGGPVLFRQVRAGMGNRTFELFKLRSMAVDAEEQLAGLLAQNRARRRTALQARPRPPGHQGRRHPAGDEPGRDPAAGQRPPR